MQGLLQPNKHMGCWGLDRTAQPPSIPWRSCVHDQARTESPAPPTQRVTANALPADCSAQAAALMLSDTVQSKPAHPATICTDKGGVDPACVVLRQLRKTTLLLLLLKLSRV